MWLIWASLVALAEGLGFNPLGQKDPMEKEPITISWAHLSPYIINAFTHQMGFAQIGSLNPQCP